MTTEDIEDEIARTRGEMADTLNAIERKLSPQQIVDQAVDAMREFLSDRSRVAGMVRDNPIPLALVGVGLGWLAVSAVTAGGSGRRVQAGTRAGSYESMEGVSPAWGGDEVGAGYAPGVESPAYGTAGSAEYAAGAASQATDAVREAAQRTRGRVSEWGRQARASANQAADRTRDAYLDHPLTMAGLALAVGAAVGAMLPRSRAESQALGEMGGELARQARQAGSELAEKASRVAERAMQGAKDEGEHAFRQEGGSPSGMTH
ncbi:MAG TPA: DUF3618 domain-containing protein [Magnetospirillum sp.]|nr:DUF3618 domain-containing protein [Magnetospirillum sp.]